VNGRRAVYRRNDTEVIPYREVVARYGRHDRDVVPYGMVRTL